MFDCGFKSQYIGGQREKFVRLDDCESNKSLATGTAAMKKTRFNLDGLGFTGHVKRNPSKSFRRGMQMSSDGLKTFSKSVKYEVRRAIVPEDLRVSETKIFDPQDKALPLWNRLFLISCIIAVSIDPLFFYLPEIDEHVNCLGIDTKLSVTTTTLRTIVDLFYILRIVLQFRTAYVAKSSRVFGRGELVVDPRLIAHRYLRRYFIVDFLSVLPLPQIVVWRYLSQSKGSEVLATKVALLNIVFLQYVPRFIRFIPLNIDLKKTVGVFAETAWAGAAYYLLLYMLASHIAGAFWYLLSTERKDTCWHQACRDSGKCVINYLYCANKHMDGYEAWAKISNSILNEKCAVEGEDSSFNYGIYSQAIKTSVAKSGPFFPKWCYCFWWGLQNLSTLGQGLLTSTYPGEVIFSICIGISGLLLFALLIGNMQTYLKSLSIRLEEMRIKRRDSEQWMHHRLLPQDLREKVRRYDEYKWLETRGVDEDSLVQSLPKDLRRDIKRHLCLNLVRRVPLFANMDERLLDAICERLKPSLYTENTYVVREGDPVDEMLFIIRGRLESVTTDGGRNGFYNRGFLKEGDFCGEELLTWALDPKSGSNLPSSTFTVHAIMEVEAFALEAEELKFVASQFRRLHSRAVQHTFRFYSQQWRTWATCFIQATWRRYVRRKMADQRRREEEEEEMMRDDDGNDDEDHYGERSGLIERRKASSSSLGATLLASRFAANALRAHRRRALSNSGFVSLVSMPKPSEPDFSVYDANSD